jgi:O-succinylhomoserine sulfhydrylase
VIVDNVFSTPMLQRPLALGADIVVYSATKHIDGQGRAMGGAILCKQQFIDDHLNQFMRHTGPSISPFNAWIFLKGLETLDIRVRQACANALQVAEFLSAQSGMNRVLYPGLKSHPQYALAQKQMSGGGTMVTFELAGGKTEAFKFLNALEIIDISNNLGDTKSLVTHPATTTHQRLSEEERAALGLNGGVVRLSVGLEDPLDICDDIARALAAARS